MKFHHCKIQNGACGNSDHKLCAISICIKTTEELELGIEWEISQTKCNILIDVNKYVSNFSMDGQIADLFTGLGVC